MVKDKIISVLKEVLKELGLPNVELVLECPNDDKHGDYSSNIALIGAKKLKQNPMELAEDIKRLVSERLASSSVDKIEVAPPGFINFHLSKDYLIGRLASQVFDLFESLRTPQSLERPEAQTRRGEAWEAKKGEGKVMVEFTDPNPFKEFHIGHLYSNVVGESLCRLLESQGAQVWRVTYQGDIGLHVAKALYGIINDDLGIKSVENGTAKDKAHFLGKCYTAGSRAYEENKNAKEEINKINKKIYEESDPAITELYQKGRQWSLDYFESIYRRLGTKFVKNYFESIAGPIGLTLVRNHIKDGVFRESEGAIIFEGKKHGLHNRVFINSLGLPTYEAKDMALPSIKYKDFQYDKSIIITAEEQSGYFEVVFKALFFINPDLAAKTKHIAHGVVRLPQGKMSSRTGNVITGQWLLDEAKAKIKERFDDIGEQVAEQVAVGAVKYALLKSGIGKDIAFSFEESISLEGNSGPYIQYTYARTRSVLVKAKVSLTRRPPFGSEPQAVRGSEEPSGSRRGRRLSRLEVEAEEASLLRLLYHFSEVVGEAAEQFAPNILCNYLFDLAQKFNLFYQKHQIIGSQQEAFRLAITRAVGQTLKNGLYLLGIAAPERM